MRASWISFILTAALVPSLQGQNRPSLQHVGFAGAILASQSARPAAQISFGANLLVGGRSFEISAGSSTGDLRSGTGTQHDAFLRTLRTWRSQYFLAGAGMGLHKVATTVNNADGGGVTRDDVASGFRPALEGMVGLSLALAPMDAAAILLTVRGAAMRGVHQYGAGLGVRLSPARTQMLLGERGPSATSPDVRQRSWDSLVAEVMLLENRLPPLHDVLATRNAIVMKLYSPNPDAMHDAVARIARVLNGSDEDIQLAIAAPDPAALAAAATSAGFPAERITTEVATKGTTLQATRPAPVTATRIAR